MRISISNIAWDPVADDHVAAILRSHGIDAVDVAPGKYFPDIPAARDGEVAAVRAAWADRGFEITGMQSLLFGTRDMNVFGPAEVRRGMLSYLSQVCRVGAGLGARRLVFGSPRNRDRSGLDDGTARAAGVTFFRELGRRAADHGVVVTLEPNPTMYGANFMTTSWETAEVVREVDHSAIQMQLDTGACAVNDEDVEQVVGECADIIGHVHLSEPRLVPVGDGLTDHGRAASTIAKHLPDRVACIEMLMSTDEAPTAAVERAVRFVVRRYRPVAQ